MTLVGETLVESRRFSGWLDPRYPIGTWLAAFQLIGDASGGFIQLNLLFQTADGPARLNSQMYSVERMAAVVTSGNGPVAEIIALNMGGPSNFTFSHQYSIQMLAQNASSQSAIAGDQFTMLPWFLGAQRTAGQIAALSLLLINANGVIVTFEAEGYRWSPRSVLVDGGPQRPPTGLYRA